MSYVKLLDPGMNRLNSLIKCNEHLSIALAELNKVAGGSYVGSISDLKKLISVKIKLENIIKGTALGEFTEKRRIK